MIKSFVVAILLFASATAVHAQPLTKPLRPFAYPFSAADTNSSALAPILNAVREARVIGLGEPTHGTAEVFCLKHRVIRHLVEAGNVRHLLLEAPVGEGADFNDYIAGKRDDLNTILGNVPLWMFQANEFADLLRWLRAYNTTAETPVRVYGMEAQYADRSARHALAYLRARDAALATRLQHVFGEQRVASDTASAPQFAHLYGPLTDSTYAAYQALFLGLRSAFDTQRDAFVAATSVQAFTEARRHVAAIGQFTSLALLENQSARAQLRDYIMAVNVADIVSSANTNERVVVWAHNEHVWKREGNGGYDVLGRQSITLGDRFDGLLFVSRSTPTTMLTRYALRRCGNRFHSESSVFGLETFKFDSAPPRAAFCWAPAGVTATTVGSDAAFSALGKLTETQVVAR